jgi:hypothetical protein
VSGLGDSGWLWIEKRDTFNMVALFRGAALPMVQRVVPRPLIRKYLLTPKSPLQSHLSEAEQVNT